MMPAAPALVEIVEAIAGAIFASAAVKSLAETFYSLFQEKLIKGARMGANNATLIAGNVQELKAASAEIDDLKRKIDHLIKKNEELTVMFSTGRRDEGLRSPQVRGNKTRPE